MWRIRTVSGIDFLLPEKIFKVCSGVLAGEPDFVKKLIYLNIKY
jgi:hypothetical protein